MKFQLSRLFLLLAGTVPTLLISGHAGAVLSPDLSLNEVKSSVNFAANTAEKLNLLVPQPENLIAKKNFRRDIRPDFKNIFREQVPRQPQTGSLETSQSQDSHLSAVATLNSLVSGDTLG